MPVANCTTVNEGVNTTKCSLSMKRVDVYLPSKFAGSKGLGAWEPAEDPELLDPLSLSIIQPYTGKEKKEHFSKVNDNRGR